MLSYTLILTETELSVTYSGDYGLLGNTSKKVCFFSIQLRQLTNLLRGRLINFLINS